MKLNNLYSLFTNQKFVILDNNFTINQNFKKYRKFVSILSFSFALNSCEIFVIGGKTEIIKEKKIINTDFKSSIGTLNLFKLEADNNNHYAMLDYISSENNLLLAIEKYEYKDEMARLTRIIRNKPITNELNDTITNYKEDITLEFDYSSNYKFMMNRIQDKWYIYNYDKVIINN